MNLFDQPSHLLTFLFVIPFYPDRIIIRRCR